MQSEILKYLRKKAKRGNRGGPVATLAFYGPDDRAATKMVASIVPEPGSDPTGIRKWFSANDIRLERGVLRELQDFLESGGIRTVVVADRIIGCAHEQGVDYEDEWCPSCPYWVGRNRWTGEVEH